MRRAALLVALAALLPVAGCGGGGSNEASTLATKHHARLATHERCPRRGRDALPLTVPAEGAKLRPFVIALKSARNIAERRVGRSPQITITVRPATHAGARGKEVSFMCSPKVARRTLVVFTWDHRYDHGPKKSASLAQHAFLVSRFDNGYRRWYVQH
jgi:hypothetical protein